MNFGRFYAIVIGNQNYQNPSEDLAYAEATTPNARHDILADKYGFTVKCLEDANDIDDAEDDQRSECRWSNPRTTF